MPIDNDSIKIKPNLTYGNPPVRAYGWRKPSTFDCGQQSRTKQSFKDDCDINLIVKRHASTGMYSHLNPRQPKYGDFSMVTDLQRALELVDLAEHDFFELPSEVRALCQNDPLTFVRAMTNPANVEKLAAAGLPMAEGWEPETTQGEGETQQQETPKDPQGDPDKGVT